MSRKGTMSLTLEQVRKLGRIIGERGRATVAREIGVSSGTLDAAETGGIHAGCWNAKGDAYHPGPCDCPEVFVQMRKLTPVIHAKLVAYLE